MLCAFSGKIGSIYIIKWDRILICGSTNFTSNYNMLTKPSSESGTIYQHTVSTSLNTILLVACTHASILIIEEHID